MMWWGRRLSVAGLVDGLLEVEGVAVVSLSSDGSDCGFGLMRFVGPSRS